MSTSQEFNRCWSWWSPCRDGIRIYLYHTRSYGLWTTSSDCRVQGVPIRCQVRFSGHFFSPSGHFLFSQVTFSSSFVFKQTDTCIKSTKIDLKKPKVPKNTESIKSDLKVPKLTPFSPSFQIRCSNSSRWWNQFCWTHHQSFGSWRFSCNDGKHACRDSRVTWWLFFPQWSSTQKVPRNGITWSHGIQRWRRFKTTVLCRVRTLVL